MKYFLAIVCLFTIFVKGQAQGCVAIRSNGSTCTITDPHDTTASKWVLNLNDRYFKSYKHFVNTEEQKQRVEQGTQVINYTNVFDISIGRILNDRWSFLIAAPIISNTRTSLYEHGGKKRYATHSYGIGDLRLAAYRWLYNPAEHMRSNVQLGLGIKLPTGDYRYQDFFHKDDTTTVMGPVDQSIQLGDGGTGITAELNAFYHLTQKVSLYTNAFYLANPREQNGVSTARGGTPSASAIAYGSHVMSVPDQYMVRAGASYNKRQLTLSGGMRMECVPAEDLIGGSNGFRRPGYVLSVEPVVAYKLKKTHFYAAVPYAIERSRTQSVPDKIRSAKTGTPYTGDAAFADYTINIGVSISLN